jgi:hypothetical protein
MILQKHPRPCGALYASSVRSLASATPRWLSRFFTVAGSSAALQRCAGEKNTGS